MDQLRQTLELQGQVARAYSPLCAAVLQAVAALHASDEQHAQRIESYYARVVAATPLEKSLRVAAVLHHYVLQGDARVASLTPFYATAGGQEDPQSPEFAAAVQAALEVLGDELFEAAIEWRVQTNETARGLAWLLPMVLLDVDAVHLIELGASAGLNLYAEERGYDLEFARDDNASSSHHLGLHPDAQFTIPVRGLELPAGLELRNPEVLSRHGGDLNPVDVRDTEAMDALRACIWGDQPERFHRLEEALQVHREAIAEPEGRPAQVHKTVLPEDLKPLLRVALPARPTAPVVVFNTYVTAYFSDVEHRKLERQLRNFAHDHALTHRVPWVWVRFEPARTGESPGPHPQWCRWRVELWESNNHHEIDLGWAHPHMAEVEFGPGLQKLLKLREGGEA